jgi:hypothetical protein
MDPISTTRRLAVTGLCTLAAGFAVAPSAHATSVQLDLGAGPIVQVDTKAVQTTVSNTLAGTVDVVAALRQSVVQRVQTTLRQANTGVVAPTAKSVANVLRASGVTAFAVVDRSGRVLRQGAVSVHNSRGLVDVAWTNDFRGCLQIALSNTLAPQVLNLDLSMPLHSRVTSGNGKARASLRNVSVAVVC